MSVQGRSKTINRMAAGCMAAILTISSVPMLAARAADTHTYVNPVVDTSDDTKVTWDCVWFGSYPQSEVVPVSLKTALDAKKAEDGAAGNTSSFNWVEDDDLIGDDTLYTQLKSATGWDSRGMLTVGKDRYLRVSYSDTTGQGAAYNAYRELTALGWDWNTGYHYFKFEPIKWRVLSVDDEAKTAILLTDEVVDDRVYTTQSGGVSWTESLLCSWLNGYGAAENTEGTAAYEDNGFYNRAFGSQEKAAVIAQTVRRSDDTSRMDKVTVLTDDTAGVWNTAYGFTSAAESHRSRYARASLYAQYMGVSLITSGAEGSTDIGTCRWALQSTSTLYAYVSGGLVARSAWGTGWDGISTGSYWYEGVRPVVKLDLSKTGVYTYAGTVVSDFTKNETAPVLSWTDAASGATGAELLSYVSNPRVLQSASESGTTTTWDTVWYGSYPQAEVVPETGGKSYKPIGDQYRTEDDLIASDSLYNSLSSADTWDASNDITIGEYRYHRIKSSDSSAASYGGSSYLFAWENETTYHYFRYQPVRWRVLSRSGSEALMIADKALDARPYHTDSTEAVEWRESTIRSWLNGYTASMNKARKDYGSDNFLDRTFTEVQKAHILISETNEDDEEATQDRIFLLSRRQVLGTITAEAYGFNNQSSVHDPARKAKSTLYAKAMGALSGNAEPDIGNASWWLRTTEKEWAKSYNIISNGSEGSEYLWTGTVAVRPSLKINLSTAEGCYYAGTIDSEGTDSVTDYPETEASSQAQIQLSNPVIVEAAEMSAAQKTTWDAVWFGTYPRSEIITSAMNRNYTPVAGRYLDSNELIVSDRLYQTLEAATDWNTNNDITINDVKYHRIRKTDVKNTADYIAPLSYVWQDSDTYHYFQYEPIKWRVLRVNGDKALLLADEVLDAQPMNETTTINNWKDVTLRSWLNGYAATENTNKTAYTTDNFIDSAFSVAQKSNLVSTTLDELDSELSDKVFLLSTTQLTTQGYGFATYTLNKDEARRSTSSLYAKARGVAWTDREDYGGNVYWWRRSTHSSEWEQSVSLVSIFGDVGTEIKESTPAIGVRPAVTIDLSVAGACEYAGTVCSDGTVSEIAYTGSSRNPNVPDSDMRNILANPRIVAAEGLKEGQRVTWDAIYFGSYPQAEVITSKMSTSYEAVPQTLINNSDFVVSDELYSRLEAATFSSDNEAVVQGIRYRRMKRADAVVASDKADAAGMYYWKDEAAYHYFQYQPIKWRVLKIENDKALIVSEKALDNQKYHADRAAVNWENSSVRSWLNGYGAASNSAAVNYTSGNFVDYAFSQEQRVLIQTTTVSNAANLTYNTAGGSDTRDRVFLLSESEVYYTQMALAYGFTLEGDVYDEARRALSTTYAKAMGLPWNTSASYYGTCLWGLRSPGSDLYRKACVYPVGYVSSIGAEVENTEMGIRPALWLDISDRSLFSYSGTVSTSGTPNEQKTDDDKEQKPTDTNDNKTDNNDNNSNTDTGTNTNISGSQPVTGISVKGKSAEMYPRRTMQLSASVLPADADNTAVTWKSSNTAYASVNSQGLVRSKKAGIGHTVTITATARDGSGVKGTYKIAIKRDKIKKITLSLGEGESSNQRTIKATITGTGSTIKKKLKWTSSNKKYATISKKGVLTVKKEGKGHTVKITAKATDGSQKKATLKIKIK